MRQVYYGWFIVAAAMIVYMLVIGTTFAAFGLFVRPVSAEFNLSRADMNTGLILLNLGNAVLAPFVGRLLDRVPLRLVIIVATFLIGGSLTVLSLSTSVILSAAVMAVPLSAGLLGAGTLAMTVLLARWFEVYRARAMLLSVIGISLGNILVAPAVGWLIETEGWRTALLVSAGAVTTVLLLVSLVLRPHPRPEDRESATAPPKQQSFDESGKARRAKPPSTVSLLRMPQFWTIAVGVGLGLAIPQAVIISIVPLALEYGMTMIQAASLISMAGITGIVGKVLLAVFADRIDRIVLLTVLIGLCAIPNAALLASKSYEPLLASAAILGLASGAITPVYFALLADRFGVGAFGTVRGLVVPVTAGTGAVGVRFIGEVFDRTGGYDLGFAIFVGIGLAAAALVFATRFTRSVHDEAPVPSGEGA